MADMASQCLEIEIMVRKSTTGIERQRTRGPEKMGRARTVLTSDEYHLFIFEYNEHDTTLGGLAPMELHRDGICRCMSIEKNSHAYNPSRLPQEDGKDAAGRLA